MNTNGRLRPASIVGFTDAEGVKLKDAVLGAYLFDHTHHHQTFELQASGLRLRLGENVLSPRYIMRGYHIRIQVTAQSASAVTKAPTKTTTTRTPARAAWTTDTFIPKSIFESLPSHIPRETSRKNAILGSKRRDYRYGPIRIDWLDLKSTSQTSPSIIKEPESGINDNEMDNTPTASPSGNGKKKDLRGRGEQAGQPLPRLRGTHHLPGGQITAKFVPKLDRAKVDVDSSDQPHGSTNLPEGVVHIFRESPSKTDTETVDESLTEGETKAELGADKNTLAVLAVPSWMTPSDFLSFVEPAEEGIVHLRMIR